MARHETQIVRQLLGLNRIQLFMPHLYFEDDELKLVRDLIVKASEGDGEYRIEDGRFVAVRTKIVLPIEDGKPKQTLGEPDERFDPGLIARFRNLDLDP